MSNESLANLLKEERRFTPPAELSAAANVTAEAYDRAAEDRLGFWAAQARRLSWSTEPTETLDWSNPPFAKWFQDGKLNVAYNCVDRHVEAGHGDRVAIYFEGEPGDTRTLTYAELQREVAKAAHALTELGVRAGDRVEGPAIVEQYDATTVVLPGHHALVDPWMNLLIRPEEASR